jgi:uncharacterized protein (TIGR03437 family)
MPSAQQPTTISETGYINGNLVTGGVLSSQPVAYVESGLSPQSTSGVVNFPVCSTITAAAPAFDIKFGENFATAFKTQGGNGNTALGSWLTNNTETGYYVSTTAGNTTVTNTASSGTRLRVIFNNIPNNVNIYVPIAPGTDQTYRGSPVGSLNLTSSESGAFSAVPASPNPTGYTGTAQLAQLTVVNGGAEAVYEVVADSTTTTELYTLPVYVASGGTVSSQPLAITAQVSFAPVGASSNIPNFSQLSDTTSLSGSQFPACLTISNTTLNSGIATTAYGQSVMATGGILPYSFSLTAGTLPPGLSLNTSTGSISGTASTVGTYSFTIGVMDSGGQSVSQPYSIQIYNALTISNVTLPNAYTAIPYNATLITNGGGTGMGYTWSVTAGSLPAGLTLNASTGKISGTATTLGSNTFTIQVSDSASETASRQFMVMVIQPLTITTSPAPPTGVAGFAYNLQLVSSGGTGGNTWSVVSGSLPPGLTLNASTGLISGTPTDAGGGSISFQVTDSNNDSATWPTNLQTVSPISILTTSLPTGAVGGYYNQTIGISGGVAPYTFSLAVPGSLQGPLMLNSSTGAITGTPTGFGTSNFTVKVTDSSGYQDGASQAYSLTIDPLLSISTASLPAATVNRAYSTTLAATGGSGSSLNYMWSAAGLPSGLTLSSRGVLSGTPSVAGTVSNVSIQVRDCENGQMASQTYSLTVYPAFNLDFVDAVTASNPIAYFRLNAAGGTDQTGNYTYTDSETGTSVMTPGAPITGPSVAYTAFDGSSGTVTTNLQGGLTTAGSLMAWVNLSAFPSTQNNFSYVAGESQIGNDFDLQFSTTNSLNFYTTNNGQFLGYTPDPVTLVNQWHMIVVTFDNVAGKRTIYWDGNLVASDTTQSIPNKTTAFQIGATNVFDGRYFPGGIEEVAVWSYALTQAQVVQLRDLGAYLPPAMQNSSYGPVNIAASGGSGSYSYSAAPLPAGLSISPGGSITGTPTATGTTAPITVTATDTTTNLTATQNFALTVFQTLTITSTLPNPSFGVAYSQTLTASGGSGNNYYWSISSGALPAGLTLSPTAGTITGTPSAGSYTFTLLVTDGVGLTASQTVNFNIGAPAPLSVNSMALSVAVQGDVYSQTFTASGGMGSDTWMLTAGALPTGVTLAANGTLSGTPTAAGSFSFTVMATDQASDTATGTFTLQVNAPLSVSTATLPPATMGTAYNQTLAASGGAGTYTWSVINGTFTNAGLTLNPATGAITGTPLTANTLQFTVQVADSNSDTATQAFNLTINLGTASAFDFAVANSDSAILRVSADGTRTSTVCSGAPCHAQDITSDSHGNIYTHDTSGIAQIAPNGTVTQVIAFSGNPLFSGGAGVGGIALDGLGNIIFVDNLQDAIYRISTTGANLTKVASFPVQSPDELQDTYVALDGSGNYIVVSDDFETAKVYRFTTAGVPTTIAAFAGRGSSGVAVDASGNIVFLDYINDAVVSVNSEGTPTVQAQGTALCCTLVGMTIDSATGSYIADLTNANGMLRITPGGAVTTILTGAPLKDPESVTQIPALIAPTISQTSLPSGTAGQFYGPVLLTATGGSGNYTWTSSGLPLGMTLSSSGTLQGVPMTAGTYFVSVTATDTTTQLIGHASLQIVVSPAPNAPPPLTISGTSSFIGVALGGSVSASFSASGGTPPYNFTATGLPGGVTLSGSGSLSGSPTQAGTFSGAVRVTDSQSNSASASITITVLGLTSTSLPGGTAGQFYSASLSATGGTAPYSFTGSGIPKGLSLSQSGALTGTVNTPGTYNISISLSDSGGLSLQGSVTVTFAAPQPLTISNAALPAGTVNSPYSQSLTASGGYSPYTWSVSSGSAPAGLSLASSGTLSGVPTTPGTFSFGVMARDSSGGVTTATASVTIQPLPLTITTQSLPSGVNGLGYPQQVLAATGGVAPYSWTVTSGNLPAGLTLSAGGSLSGLPTVSGSFPVTIGATDQSGSKGSATFTITIRPASPGLVVSVSSLNFSLLAPASAVPPAQQVGVQSIQSGQVLAYTIAVSPSAPWLTLTNGLNTPDTIQVSLNSAALSLAAGSYSTNITVSCSATGCAGNSQTVSVNLNVQTAAPQLTVGTTLLAFAGSASSSQSLSQSLTVQNTGGGSIGFSSVTCEASWCTVSSIPATVAGGTSASLTVSVNPALLTAGFFRTQVDIVSSAGRASVPVTVLLAAASSMALNPAGQQFSSQQGGAPGNPAGSFLVTVANGGTITWTASLLPGASWLILNTPSGSSSAGAPGSVAFSIDPVAAAALAPGPYYGQIEVDAPGAVNSPQNFEVVLNVSPPTMPVIPDVQPAGLLFITSAGTIAPPQTVTVYSGSGTPGGFQASAIMINGTGWLAVSPATGTSSDTSPGITSVTVNASALTPGVYQGGVNYSLSATAVRQVNVTLIVTPTGASGLPSGNQPEAASGPRASSCTPSMLVPVETGLVNNFSAAVAWPVPLSILLENDCGLPVNSGQMVATFSNGDPPVTLSLANSTSATYSGTWTPRSAASQVNVVARASAPGYPNAMAQVEGATLPNAAPVLTPHGTLHSFDPLVGAALAPGTIIQIYGQNLATGTAQPTTIPLPTTMNGTSVLIGGIPAPLYFVSPAQINAQLPFELTAGNQFQILVTVDGALTTPDSIQLSPATPGLAAFSDGTLIAQHADGSLVSTTAPARSGEYLVAYLAGMGATNATPDSGAASPSSPLALPAVAPVLTINGTVEPILFAGLTPGLVGLYQMNFQVPSGFPAGDLTLVVTQDGQASNQTVLPYRP